MRFFPLKNYFWKLSCMIRNNKDCAAACYRISCSRFRNTSEWKNSSKEMPSPSQSFLMVEMVVLLFRLLIMLLMVDWVTPLIEQSLLTEISRSWQSSKILSRTAAPTVIKITSPRLSFQCIWHLAKRLTLLSLKRDFWIFIAKTIAWLWYIFPVPAKMRQSLSIVSFIIFLSFYHNLLS